MEVLFPTTVTECGRDTEAGRLGIPGDVVASGGDFVQTSLDLYPGLPPAPLPPS